MTATSDANGLVTFSNLSINGTSGSVTLNFTASLNGTQASVISQGVVITPPPPTQLAMAVQPSANATSGVILSQQPSVQLKDANGNNAAQGGVQLTVSIVGGTATIGGTATVASDANGLVTFTGLSLTGSTGTVTLMFSATLNGQSVNVTSSPINLTLPPVTSVVITGSVRVKVGDPYTYTATAKLADGTIVQRPLTWSVLVPGTATITAGGVLTPIATGTITIVATIDGVPWVGTTTGYDWVFLNFGTGIGATLESDDSFVDWFGNTEFANLQIACGNTGTFSVGVGFLGVTQMLTNDGLVTFGGDNGILTSQTWLETPPTYHVLVYPSLTNGVAKTFANAIASNHLFVFAFDEFLNGSHAVTFRVTGMTAAMAPLMSACPSNFLIAGADAAPTTSAEALWMATHPTPASPLEAQLQTRRASSQSVNLEYPMVRPTARAADVIRMQKLHP